MEDLSDPALKLNLDCIRPGLINRDAEGHVRMVPVFSRSYGMLVNKTLFEKEGLSVPSTWTELMAVCEAFRGKGYASPMMGYSLKSSSCFMNTVAYPLFVATLAKNKEALTLANNKSSGLAWAEGAERRTSASTAASRRLTAFFMMDTSPYCFLLA